MIQHLGASAPRPGALQLPYTPAMRAGDFVFVSGQLGLDMGRRPARVSGRMA